MPRRALPALLTALLLAGCGAAAEKPTTSSEKPAATAPKTTPRRTAAPADKPIAGAGVGPQEFAAVERLARHGKPVYCGGGKGDMVALTFDDGPGPYTHYVLKRLRRNKMRATFFLNSKTFDLGFSSLVEKELPYGTVGNHTANHKYLPGLSESEMHFEIDSSQDRIGKQAGFPVILFRTPYGATNDAINAHVKARRMLQILWNVDSLDSQGANYAKIRDGVIASLRPGAIILMHDNRGQTVRALPDILHAVRHKHLKAVTIPELMRHDPPSTAQLDAGPRGCPGTR